MASLKISRSYVEDLRSAAKALIEAGFALNELFDKEEAWLKREDEASSLRAIHRTIVGQLGRIKRSESSARHGDAQANLLFSLTGLAARIIVAATTGSQRAWNVVDSVFDTEGHKKSFGTVMICVGPEGLPDNVRVVPISQLARESNRPQAEIIDRLQDSGYLLFSEEAFSLLIDRMIHDIREGKLHLPVSGDKLAEIAALSRPKLLVKPIPMR